MEEHEKQLSKSQQLARTSSEGLVRGELMLLVSDKAQSTASLSPFGIENESSVARRARAYNTLSSGTDSDPVRKHKAPQKGIRIFRFTS